MNRALVAQHVRHVLASPSRPLLAAAVAITFALRALVTEAPIELTHLAYFPLLAGILGTDARTGLLRTILARPVSRPRLVFTRYVAGLVLTLPAALVVAPALTACGVLIAERSMPPARLLLHEAGAQALVALGLTAAMIFWSSFLPGAFDAAAAALAMPVGYVIGRSVLGGLPGMEHALDVVAALAGLTADTPAGPIAGVTGNTALLLLLALVVMHRRQVPAGAR